MTDYGMIIFSPYKEFGINLLANGDDGREVRDGLPDPRLEYYKFLIARHPLERLASAYLDKVARNKPGKRPCVKRIKVQYQCDCNLYNKIIINAINVLNCINE